MDTERQEWFDTEVVGLLEQNWSDYWLPIVVEIANEYPENYFGAVIHDLGETFLDWIYKQEGRESDTWASDWNYRDGSVAGYVWDRGFSLSLSLEIQKAVDFLVELLPEDHSFRVRYFK